MLCVISEQCLIEAQAYGGTRNDERRDAYVKLNGVAVWQASIGGEYPNRRGVNLIVVDPTSCTKRDSRNYDTYANSNDAYYMRNHLRTLSDGTVLVAVTCDDASRYLRDAFSTLREFGADVSDVRHRGAWVFVAEKGDPASTVFEKELYEQSDATRQPRVAASFAGAQCNL